MNRRLPGLIFWLLALALLGWSLRQLPLSEMLGRIGQIAWRDLLLWIVVNLAILYLAVTRWQILTHTIQCPLSLATLFRLRQAGSTVSFVTPGPQFGGEPLQLYWLHRSCGLALHQAIAALGMERFMETATNFAVLLAGLTLLLLSAMGPAGEWLEAAVLLALALTALLIMAALAIRHPDWLADRLQRFAGHWGGMANTGRKNSDAVNIDKEPTPTAREGYLALMGLLRQALTTHRATIGLAILVSLLGWSALLLELAVLLHALGLNPTVNDIVLIMVAMRLAMLLPVPGGLGTIEGSVVWSFGLLGLPLAAAGGLIALSRLRDAVMLLIGFVCMGSFKRQPEPASRD
jgi:uncharacterized protein (TIRG00374 family)